MELVRQKNVATYIVAPLVDADGDSVTGATGLDSEIDAFADGSAPDGFADCSNEASEVGATGSYSLSLTQGEMNQDYIIIQIKSNEAKTQWILIRTTVGDPLNLATTDDGTTINVNSGVVESNVKQVSDDGTAADDLELLVENAKGADHKILISTDPQDLSTTFDVNMKTITAGIIANASFNADVGSTVYASNVMALAGRKVLDELNLDHLMKVVTAGADMTTEIVDNTALSRILSNGDTSAFDPSTDGLQPIRDRGDAEWITATGFNTTVPDAAGTAAGLHATTDAILNHASYGLAKLVRSTTPANTLDVSGTGEAGLDFDNIKAASAPTTLTNITVPTVTTVGTTTTNTDMRGTDSAALAATALSTATWTAARAGYLDSINGHTAQTGDSYAIVNHATYGNDKLVRSTTPANTFDVSATGEGGLDFDNIKAASGATTLTNITVPVVTTVGTTTTNTDMRGTDSAALAATALSDATWTDARAGYLDELAAANLPADIDNILADTVLMDKWIKNRIAFSGTSMILYDDDNTTPLLTWTLSQGSTSVSGPYNRAKAA